MRTKTIVSALVVSLFLVLASSAHAALMLYWPLEGAGNQIDSSSNNRDGAVQNGATWDLGDLPTQLTGISTGSYLFAGTDDRIFANGPGGSNAWTGVIGTNSRTMSAWIKTNDNQATIMAWGQNVADKKWVFRTDGENLRVEVNGGWARGTADVRDDTWHHVLATWENDGSPNVQDVRFYVDGVLDPVSASLSKNVNTASSMNYRLGVAENNGKDFTGNIDDAAVWNEVLSPGQIYNLANANRTPLTVSNSVDIFFDDDSADGLWSTEANWGIAGDTANDVRPTVVDNAYIGNGDTATVTAAGAETNELRVGHSNVNLPGNGTLNVTGGSLAADYLTIGDGTATGQVTLSGGTLQIGDLDINAGSTFSWDGGGSIVDGDGSGLESLTATIDGGTFERLHEGGWQSSGMSFEVLNGGQLLVGEDIGDNKRRDFTIDGGASLTIGTSGAIGDTTRVETKNLRFGGTGDGTGDLYSGLIVCDIHDPNDNTPVFEIGVYQSGQGTFTQHGGTVFADKTDVGRQSGAAGDYYMQGGTLQTNLIEMDNTGTFHWSGGTLTGLDGTGMPNLLFTGGEFDYARTDNQTLTGDVQVNNDSGTFRVGDASAELTISGLIHNTGPLSKRGPGTLKLTNSNTYSGNTTIYNGTLDLTDGQIYSGSGTYTGIVTVNSGGVLLVDHFGKGAGTSTSLGNQDNTAEHVVLNGGTLRISGDDGSNRGRAVTIGSGGGTIEVADGSFTMGSDTLANSYTAGSTLTLSGAGTGQMDKFISGAGVNLIKDGSGTWTLGRNNTYTGLTTISDGLLKMGVNNALGTAAAGTVITDGGALDLAGKQVGDEQITISGNGTDGVGGQGAIINTGGSQLQGANGVRYLTLAGDAEIGGNGGNAARFDINNELAGGTYTLTKVGDNRISIQTGNVSVGDIIVNDGWLIVQNNGALGNTAYDTTINPNGVLRLWNVSNVPEDITLAGGEIRGGPQNNQLSGDISQTISSTIYVDNNGTVTLSGSRTGGSTSNGAGRLTKTGPGTVVITGDHSGAHGGWNFIEGEVQVGHEDNLGGDWYILGYRRYYDFVDTVSGTADGLSSGVRFTGDTTLSADKHFYIEDRDNASYIEIDGGVSLTMNSQFFGPNDLTIQGAGTLNYLDNTNFGNEDFRGNLTIDGATMDLSVGRLYVNQNYYQAPANDGTVTVTGGGTLIVSDWTRGNSGSLGWLWHATDGSASNQFLKLDNGTLRVTDTTAEVRTMGVLGGGGTLSVDTGATWTLQRGSGNQSILWASGNGTLTLTGAGTGILNKDIQSGLGNLIKTGSGTWILGGNNSYSGTTTVNEGTLQVGNNGTLGTLGAGTVNVNNATLALNRSDGVTISTDINFNNGTLHAIDSVNNINGHPTNNLDLTGTVLWTVNAGATLNINNNGGDDNVGFSGNPTLILDGAGNGSISRDIARGSADGTIIKNGTGTWTLSGQMAAGEGWSTGGLTINGGRLATGTANVIPYGTGKGDLTVNSPGLLDLTDGGVNINGLIGDGTVEITGSSNRNLILGHANPNVTFSGVIQNTGTGEINLTKLGSGTQVLTGTNTYTGTTTVNGGTLQIGEAGAGSIVSEVTVNSGGTLAGTGIASNSIIVNGTVSPGDNSGDAIGTLHVGPTTFNPGSTLAIQLDPSTTLNPGDPGYFTPTGWGDVSTATSSDTLDVSGELTLAGTLDLRAIGDGWSRGQEFNILDFDLALNDADGDGMIDTTFEDYIIPYLYEDGYAVLTHDELVSGQFLPNLGETGEGIGGSLSWDFTDLYSQGIIRVVPEPGTWALFALGLLGFGWFVRRKVDTTAK